MTLPEEITTSIPAVALGAQPFLSVPDLSGILTIAGDEITLRDFIRQTFFDLGIEIEFSGKNHNEKGVVIDIDEDKLTASGLNSDTLRFGQTVVKVIAR